MFIWTYMVLFKFSGHWIWYSQNMGQSLKVIMMHCWLGRKLIATTQEITEIVQLHVSMLALWLRWFHCVLYATLHLKAPISILIALSLPDVIHQSRFIWKRAALICLASHWYCPPLTSAWAQVGCLEFPKLLWRTLKQVVTTVFGCAHLWRISLHDGDLCR